jgi:Uma2 family endonuclease
MSALPEPLEKSYTPEAYFELLSSSKGQKYEYEQGKVYAMAGGTGDHSCIKTDTMTYLAANSRNSGCEPYDSDMAVYVPQYNSFVLPDLSFVCGEPLYEDEARRRLLNPSLLVEVMSETSELYDRSKKFIKYRSLTSFREYVLIDSQQYLVEYFYKQDDKLWKINSCHDREGSVRIHTLGIDLPLSEIYRRVTL